MVISQTSKNFLSRLVDVVANLRVVVELGGNWHGGTGNIESVNESLGFKSGVNHPL